MKRSIFLSILFLFTVFSGCDDDINESGFIFNHDSQDIVGSGHLVTIEKEYSGFIHIAQHYSFESTIIRGDSYSVIIRIDDNLTSYLSTYQEGEKISLGLIGGNNYRDITLKAVITMPDIYSLSLTGASRAEIYGFDVEHYLNLHLSGASSVVANINTGNVLFELSGASEIDFNGTGNNIYVRCSGASKLDLLGYNFNNADVSLSGASISLLNIFGNLSASLSGASILYYRGYPTIINLVISGESRFIRLL